MDIYEILLQILDKPDASKFYRELRDYYRSINKLHEASALDILIEKRLKKKDDPVLDNPNVN